MWFKIVTVLYYALKRWVQKRCTARGHEEWITNEYHGLNVTFCSHCGAPKI